MGHPPLAPPGRTQTLKAACWRAGLRTWALALLMAALPVQPCSAGPWRADTPQGLQVHLVQDSFRARDGYLLERRYPDGTPDAGFGQQGALVFTLGPDNEGPAALRADAQGRLWVAGASLDGEGRLHAVVLRFLPHGVPDGGYATQGRSAVQPGGLAARALDLLPLSDGSAWVAGLLQERDGRERAGLWRLQPDGRVDPAFGDGGLWRDPDARPAEVQGLAAGADGGVSLQLQRSGTAAAETWRVAQGGTSLQRAGVPASPPAAEGREDPAMPAPSPFGPAGGASASAAPAGQPGAAVAGGAAAGAVAWALAGAVALGSACLALWWWRRRARRRPPG